MALRTPVTEVELLLSFQPSSQYQRRKFHDWRCSIWVLPKQGENPGSPDCMVIAAGSSHSIFFLAPLYPENINWWKRPSLFIVVKLFFHDSLDFLTPCNYLLGCSETCHQFRFFFPVFPECTFSNTMDTWVVWSNCRWKVLPSFKSFCLSALQTEILV